MSKTVIYHNPRCSKSRQTLALLQENNIEPEVIEYLKTPPDADTLKSLLKKLHCKPRQLMRHKEAIYHTLKLNDESLEEDALIAAMIEHPELIERPIVVHKHKAALGRPPEAVLEIL